MSKTYRKLPLFWSWNSIYFSRIDNRIMQFYLASYSLDPDAIAIPYLSCDLNEEFLIYDCLIAHGLVEYYAYENYGVTWESFRRRSKGTRPEVTVVGRLIADRGCKYWIEYKQFTNRSYKRHVRRKFRSMAKHLMRHERYDLLPIKNYHAGSDRW